MRSLFRRRSGEESEVGEDIESVSVNLPYELQSKIFDQLATVGIAGAGLSVTLIGSLLRNAPPMVWTTVVMFGLAAITAVSGNIRLIDDLRNKQPALKRSKSISGFAMALIGAGIGFLSMEVYSAGERRTPPLAEGGQVSTVRD